MGKVEYEQVRVSIAVPEQWPDYLKPLLHCLLHPSLQSSGITILESKGHVILGLSLRKYAQTQSIIPSCKKIGFIPGSKSAGIKAIALQSTNLFPVLNITYVLLSLVGRSNL